MKAAHVRRNAHAPLFIAEVNLSTDTLSSAPPRPPSIRRCPRTLPVILPTLQLSSVSSCCSVFGKEGCAAWKPVSSSIPPWPLYSPSSGVSSIVQGQSIVRSLHSKRLAVVRIASGLLSTPTKRQPSDCAASIAVPLPQHKSATMSPSRTTGSSRRSSSFSGFCVG